MNKKTGPNYAKKTNRSEKGKDKENAIPKKKGRATAITNGDNKIPHHRPTVRKPDDVAPANLVLTIVPPINSNSRNSIEVLEIEKEGVNADLRYIITPAATSHYAPSQYMGQGKYTTSVTLDCEHHESHQKFKELLESTHHSMLEKANLFGYNEERLGSFKSPMFERGGRTHVRLTFPQKSSQDTTPLYNLWDLRGEMDVKQLTPTKISVEDVDEPARYEGTCRSTGIYINYLTEKSGEDGCWHNITTTTWGWGLAWVDVRLFSDDTQAKYKLLNEKKEKAAPPDEYMWDTFDEGAEDVSNNEELFDFKLAVSNGRSPISDL